MEIAGIGTDIVECLRVGRMIERHGELFLRRVYTAHEIAYCQTRKRAVEHFAARCASEPTFLAYALAAYQRRHGLTDELLAEVLGCTRDALTRLRLCGMPRVHCFANDCRQIAEKFAARAEVLDEMGRTRWRPDEPNAPLPLSFQHAKIGVGLFPRGYSVLQLRD